MGRHRKQVQYDEDDDDDDYYGEDDYDDDHHYSNRTATTPKAKAAPQPKAAKPKAKEVTKKRPQSAKTLQPDPSPPPSRPQSASASSKIVSPQLNDSDEEGLLDGCPPSGDDQNKTGYNLVVVGHVDSGKSTLTGHLLLRVGAVTNKTFQRFSRESKDIGRDSFAFAWILDEGTDERARGVTIDVTVKHLDTKSKCITMLDAPGHKDFVPNMLAGAAQADVALLVIDSIGFDERLLKRGQTREHLQLVRALGISRLIIAVNKLEKHNWSQEEYQRIVAILDDYVTGREVGYKPQNVQYIPVSAFTGINLTDNNCDELKQWWKGPLLIDALDCVDVSAARAEALQRPFRAVVSDVWATSRSMKVSCKVDSGRLSVGQSVLILPSNTLATAKDLQLKGYPVTSAEAGSYVDLCSLVVNHEAIEAGSVLCDPHHPPPHGTTCFARVMTFWSDTPIVSGLRVMVHLHTAFTEATITVISQKSHAGAPVRSRTIATGSQGVIEVTFARAVCFEHRAKGTSSSSVLSRLIIRDGGITLAAGTIIPPHEAHN